MQALFAPISITLANTNDTPTNYSNIANLITNSNFSAVGDFEDNFIDARQMQVSPLGAPSTSGLDGNDTILVGDIDNDIYGGDDNDHLFGGKGHDFLFGNFGADKLYGGAGDDRLTGGGGADKFVLGSVDGDTDIVTDFKLEDSILVQVSAPLTGAPADLNALLTALGLTLSDGTDRTGNNVNDIAIMDDQSILMILEGVDIIELDTRHFEVDVI